MKKLLFALAALAALFPAGAYALNLTAQGAGVYDSAGGARQSFTTAESITLRQSVSNAVTIARMMTLSFNRASAICFIRPARMRA